MSTRAQSEKFPGIYLQIVLTFVILLIYIMATFSAADEKLTTFLEQTLLLKNHQLLLLSLRFVFTAPLE
jgi:hypothetical protein